MDRQALIDRFEQEMGMVQREGVDQLMDYIRKSDFYVAPASTRYHLACEGGLLQHSLNVLDALRGILEPSAEGHQLEYKVAGVVVDTIPEESAILISLLHDICKTHFYRLSTRNQKNKDTGRWEQVPYFEVEDAMPLGHGSKSAMIVKEYITLTPKEMYAIWWHMGFTGNGEDHTLGSAIEKHPIIWALHTADLMASRMMELRTGNKDAFGGAIRGR